MFDERTIKILDELGLTPGVIDGNAKHVFTTSHCDELAWALHRLTGHPVIVASNREHKHAGVLRDDDTVLDIDGAEPKRRLGCPSVPTIRTNCSQSPPTMGSTRDRTT